MEKEHYAFCDGNCYNCGEFSYCLLSPCIVHV